MPFDPNAFEQYKAQQAPADSGGFDPAKLAAYKAQAEQPSLSQKIWQATAAPRNALRGIDTGVESFLEGKGSHQATIDGIQAMLAAKYLPNQPAPEGSKIAYALSNVQDPRYLPLNFVPGSGYAGAAVKGALAGAEGSALGDLENSGTTTPGSVGAGAAVGGVVGPVAHGITSLAAEAPEIIKSGVGLAKRAYTAASLVRPGVLAGLEENPAAVKAALGTSQSQRTSAQALQNGIEDRLNNQLGAPVREAKSVLGITPAPTVPELPALKQAASEIISSPLPANATPEQQVERIRVISHLKDQINQSQNNLFANGNTDVLQKRINPNAEAPALKNLFGQLNEQMKSIPAAQPLADANAAYSPARTAYDDVLQRQFGGQTGRAQSRVSAFATADPNTTSEAMRPDVDNAMKTMGGNVPNLYQAAKAEAVKRAIGLPVNKANTNVAKLIASSPFRAMYVPAIDSINTLGRALNLPAQAVSPLGSAADTMSPNLLAALMAKSKQHQ